MKVLHICNSYCSTKVHSELYSELDKLGVEQIVYTYPMNLQNIGNNRFEANHTEFIYSDASKKSHKYLYHKKIHDLFKDVCERVDMTTIDCIHATTLFSDGGVAYKLHLKYGIPYVVAARNTDVNEFMGYAPHTWPMGRKIIAKAQKLVFISPSLYQNFCHRRFFRDIAKTTTNKAIFCPNGINRYWLEHRELEDRHVDGKILYIGRFDKNKNVLRLVRAVLRLKEQVPEIHLSMVGVGGEEELEIKRLAEANKDTLSFLGPIYDKDKLRDIMRHSSLFAMVSIFETFGLVYVEALSQGLPILFTEHQGVDGYFSKDTGVAVNPKDINSIQRGLSELITHRNQYLGYKLVDFSQFDWQSIAKKYKEIILNTNYETVAPIHQANN